METEAKTWWRAYEDETVWPCELVDTNYLLGVQVRALKPAPDAGEVHWVPKQAVYDSRFNHPTKNDVPTKETI